MSLSRTDNEKAADYLVALACAIEDDPRGGAELLNSRTRADVARRIRSLADPYRAKAAHMADPYPHLREDR